MTILALLTDEIVVNHGRVGHSLPPMIEAALRRMGEPATVEAQMTGRSQPAPKAWMRGHDWRRVLWTF